MGADASCFLVLGIPVERSDFFTDGGTLTRCGKGHPSTGGGPYCPQDGTPFKTVRAERMTEALAAWSAKKGYDDPWDALCDTYGRSGLGLFNVEPVQSSEDRGRTLALGYRLMEAGGYTSGLNTIDVEAAQLSSTKLIEEAAELGIKGTPKLFLCLYWSV